MLLSATPEEVLTLLREKTDPVSLHNKAVAHRTLNHLDESQEIAYKLWQEDGYRQPELALLISNLFLDCGRYERCEEFAMNAWQLQAPNETPEFALPLATARMRLGKWDSMTWHLWEIGRFERSWHPVPGTQRWRGEDEPVVVLSEGGYGDAFLFSRFLPQTPGDSLVVFGPQFAGLKGFRQDWGMPSIWFDEPLPSMAEFGYSTALMSFLATLKIERPDQIPPDITEKLQALDALIHPEVYRRPVGSPRFGLCWQAEENGVQKRIRSISNPKDFEPIAKFSFVSLCPAAEHPRRDVNTFTPVLFDPEIKSWTDTARIIAGLDMVVSVDTAVAHLAGMLGVPCLCIVPLAVDWKYGVEGEECYWWKSVRVIRNTSPYTFRPALERVAEILEKL